MRHLATVVDDGVFAVGHHFGDIHRGHHLVGAHVDAVYLVEIEDGHIEARAGVVLHAQVARDARAYHVVLVLERPVESAVIGVDADAAQMARESVDAGDETALEVVFHQFGGKRHVHTLALTVIGSTLNVEVALITREDAFGEVLCHAAQAEHQEQ